MMWRAIFEQLDRFSLHESCCGDLRDMDIVVFTITIENGDKFVRSYDVRGPVDHRFAFVAWGEMRPVLPDAKEIT